MKIRTKITVDLTRPESIPMLHVKQGDSAREVEVTLCAGSSLVIPTTEEINIYIKKPDGTKVYNACSISDGKIIIPMKTQSVSFPGRGEAELQMVSGADVISTPIFSLDIMPTNIDDSAIESTNDFSALVQAIQDVNELKKNGIKGDPGRAATVDIGLVTTLEPGSDAFVSNSGTENDAVLNFGIPKGEKGDTGSVEVVTDAPVTYETPDTYEPPASGNIFRTWLGRVTKGLDNIITNIGTLASLSTTDKSSLVAAANELKLLADGKISLSKILTSEEWAAAISERGFLADAKDVKDYLEQLNTNLASTNSKLLKVHRIYRSYSVEANTVLTVSPSYVGFTSYNHIYAAIPSILACTGGNMAECNAATSDDPKNVRFKSPTKQNLYATILYLYD